MKYWDIVLVNIKHVTIENPSTLFVSLTLDILWQFFTYTEMWYVWNYILHFWSINLYVKRFPAILNLLKRIWERKLEYYARMCSYRQEWQGNWTCPSGLENSEVVPEIALFLSIIFKRYFNNGNLHTLYYYITILELQEEMCHIVIISALKGRVCNVRVFTRNLFDIILIKCNYIWVLCVWWLLWWFVVFISNVFGLWFCHALLWGETMYVNIWELKSSIIWEAHSGIARSDPVQTQCENVLVDK